MTDSNRDLIRAVDRLTTQVRRIADGTARDLFALAPPVVTDDDGAQTTSVRHVTTWLPLCESRRHLVHSSQTCDEVDAFTEYVQDWAQRAAVPDLQVVTATMRENEQLRTELARINTRRTPGGEGYISLTIDEQVAMAAELARIRRALDPDDETYIRETVADQLDMTAKLETATATLKRVRALHARTTIQSAGGPVDVCVTCESDAMSHPWPCPTTEALAGPTTDH